VIDVAYAESSARPAGSASPGPAAHRYHHHEWVAGGDDDRWRCSKPGCFAWISRLADRAGRIIPLPRDRAAV